MLSARSTQFTAEAAALVKVVEEKTAAHKPLAESLAAAKLTIDAALGKLAPAKAALLQTEQAMLEHRRKAAADAQALAAFDTHLETSRKIANLQKIAEAIAAAQAAETLRVQEVAAAEKLLADYAPVMAQQQANVKTATDTMTQTTAALAAVRAEHAKKVELASAIDVALKSSEVAATKAGEDPALAEVVAKLKERSSIALAQGGESQKLVDAAAANEKTAAEALAAAQKAMADAAAEQTRREQATNAAKAAARTGPASAPALESRLPDLLLEEPWKTAGSCSSKPAACWC